jgi:hypothetical protein
MKIPGFTAESSLVTSGTYSCRNRIVQSTDVQVIPQRAVCRVMEAEEFELVFGIHTEYGGMVCTRH